MSTDSIVLALIAGVFGAVVSPLVVAWINRRHRKVKDERDLWELYQEVKGEVADLWELLNQRHQESATAWNHIEDVWHAIGQEPDGGKAIESRLRWLKPSRPVPPERREHYRSREKKKEEG